METGELGGSAGASGFRIVRGAKSLGAQMLNDMANCLHQFPIVISVDAQLRSESD